MNSPHIQPHYFILFVATILSATAAGQDVPPPAANEPAAVVDPNPNFLATVIEKLAPESRQAFAAMLSSDWQDRPDWAEMMITILAGKEMGLGAGWYQPSQK